MNRSLIAKAPGNLVWQEVETPVPEKGKVLIRAEYGAIKHGTEFSMVSGKAFSRGTCRTKRQSEDKRLLLKKAGRRGGA